jgi:hypothetical protein
MSVSYTVQQLKAEWTGSDHTGKFSALRTGDIS